MRRHQSLLKLRSKTRGFTLIELALVIAVIALMVSGMMTPVSVMLDQRKYSETNDLLIAANDALVFWLMALDVEFEVLAPASLQQRLRVAGQRALRCTGTRSS